MIKMSVNIGGAEYDVDLKNPLNISIPVRFEGAQLSAFGGGAAKKEVYKAEGFCGDVRQGGSCNCEVYTFSPHLNGTHTECIGHITAERMSVCAMMKEAFIPATLVTVVPEGGIITKASIEKALSAVTPAQAGVYRHTGSVDSRLRGNDKNFLTALVIRTAPNGKDKATRDYNKNPPAYFSNEAMQYIVSLGVSHLLVDFPSVDRVDDNKLSNHRIFWDSPHKTITELVYAQDDVQDGHYLLNLQVAAMEGDAASSRPLLFRVNKK